MIYILFSLSYSVTAGQRSFHTDKNNFDISWDLLPQNQDNVDRNTWWFLSVFALVIEGFLSRSPIPSVWYSWVWLTY